MRPEAILQTNVGKFVRSAVTVPHRFACFDRSANDATGRRHLWEKNRHIRKGEPDTELLVPSIPAIRVELKAGSNKPTDDQWEQGRQIQAAGHHWGWTNSVEGYGELLEGWGVPLAVNWRFQAQHYDGLIASKAAKEPLPKRKAPPRQQPAAARVRRVQAIMDGLHAREPLFTGVKR